MIAIAILLLLFVALVYYDYYFDKTVMDTLIWREYYKQLDADNFVSQWTQTIESMQEKGFEEDVIKRAQKIAREDIKDTVQ